MIVVKICIYLYVVEKIYKNFKVIYIIGKRDNFYLD